MKQYLEALQHVLDNGEKRTDRTGVGTVGVFGYQMRFNLQEGFPAVTTKKLAWKAVVGELLWFLEGSSDERRLAEITYNEKRELLKDKTTIWTANADNQGKQLGYTNTDTVKKLGPVYGKQWRNFGGVDQIVWAIQQVVQNPDSRRIIVSAWNPPAIEHMALPPCHTMFQLYVSNGKLSCQLYQRSCDMFLGLPFNIASYALLTHMIAEIAGLEVGDFVHTIGDAHIYSNHIEQVKQQLQRDSQEMPTLNIGVELNSLHDIIDSNVLDYTLEDYNPMSSIKAPMAI